jgi:hypothetical protein
MSRAKYNCSGKVASGAGLMGAPMMAPYSASKHAVLGLTRSAAVLFTCSDEAQFCTGIEIKVNGGLHF